MNNKNVPNGRVRSPHPRTGFVKPSSTGQFGGKGYQPKSSTAEPNCQCGKPNCPSRGQAKEARNAETV